MNQDFREKNKKGFDVLQSVRHFTMAILFVAMGILLFAADKYHIVQLLEFDKTFRYIFASICLLYGAFRLYRGLKKDY